MKSLFFENSPARFVAMKAASLLSKNAALGPLSTLRYADVPEPALPNPRWLKLRNHACGLCGTDLHFMYMELDPRCFPAASPGIAAKHLGHELVGEVFQLGDEVGGGLQLGDRVAMRIDWPSCFQMELDPPCAQCAAGNYMLCENLGRTEPAVLHTGGGFSPYMVMHRTQPFRIPDELGDDAALLIEPMASAVHGVLKAPPEAGQTVLVLGAGTIGLLTVAAIRSLSPETLVHCLSRYPFQSEVVRALGAEVLDEGDGLYERIAERTGARKAKGQFGNQILLGGFDTIYDTVGSDHSLHHALRWIRGGGKLVMIGINFKPGKIDYTPIWAQEIEVVGINCHATEEGGETSFGVAARLLLQGCVEPGAVITHRFPVAKWKDAVKTFIDKKRTGAIKIVLEHPA